MTAFPGMCVPGKAVLFARLKQSMPGFLRLPRTNVWQPA